MINFWVFLPSLLPSLTFKHSFTMMQATRHARRVYVGGLPPMANEQVRFFCFVFMGFLTQVCAFYAYFVVDKSSYSFLVPRMRWIICGFFLLYVNINV